MRLFSAEHASTMTKIYVGNLPFSANEGEIRELFGQHGAVESVSLIMDRETGRPRGSASWRCHARMRLAPFRISTARNWADVRCA